MISRTLFSCLLLSVVVAGCATPPPAEKIAELRALDAESAAELALEGELLFEADPVKKDGYQYCLASIELADQGEFRRAIREATKALYLGERQGDHLLIANAKRDLAYAYSLAGYLERAKQLADETLYHFGIARIPPSAPPQRPVVIAPALKVRGDVQYRQGKLSNAIADYRSALSEASPQFRPYINIALGNAFLSADRGGEAEDAFRRAEREAPSTLRPYVLRGLAKLAVSRGNAERAVQLYQETLLDVPDEDPYYRVWALAGLGAVYASIGEMEDASKAYADAIAMMETVRARFRSEEFKTGFFGDFQSIFDEAIETFVALGDSEIAFNVSERSRSRALRDLIRERVEFSHGTEVYTDSVRNTSTAREIQDLLSPGMVLVEFYVMDERTHAWIVTSSSFTHHAIEISERELAELANELRTLARDQADLASLQAKAAQLHALLFPRLSFETHNNLVIVPHGALHYVPFGALRAGDQYLIEQAAVTVAPSGSTVLDIVQRKDAEGAGILALGNPQLGDPRLSLPGAEDEVRAIKVRHPQAEIFIQDKATKQALIGNAPSSQLIHVAAHAEVDEIDPLYSVIRLAPSPDASGDLEAHEVYRVDLAGVELVVLSACDSGLGLISEGDEIWGFTRTFLGAGADSVIVSLWPIQDESTKIFMEAFYEYLKKNSIADSLRHAAIALLKEERTQHPYYWSSFMLSGSWR